MVGHADVNAHGPGASQAQDDRPQGGISSSSAACICFAYTYDNVYYVKSQRDPISTDLRQLTVVVKPRTRLAVDLKKLHSRHDSLAPTLFSGCCASRRNGLIV